MSVSPSFPVSLPTIVSTLRAAGCVFAEDEADLLVRAATGPGDLTSMLQQRVDGLPLEQVLGWARFCGLRIAVEPGVFVPRRRTEFLARQAASLAPGRAVVVDLCCGSGAVAAALVATSDVSEVYAVDIDPVAVVCARRNLPAGTVLVGDLYAPLPEGLSGRVDVLVANAPYVPTGAVGLLPREARIYEPRVALDGGTDGLDVQRRVAAGAARWLAPGGHLLIETSRSQAAGTARAFTRCGFSVEVACSDELDATVVIGARARE